jgi:hypothetical protein
MNSVPSSLPLRLVFVGSLLSMLPNSVVAAGRPPLRVNVGRFTGSDARLTAAVTETLLTDMAKSGRLALLNGRSPSARTAGAAFTLTGSCMLFDDSVVINARLIDTATGRTIPGGAANVDGHRSEVFPLVHSLATRLVLRLTGAPPTPDRRVATNRLNPNRTVRPPFTIKPPAVRLPPVTPPEEETGQDYPGERGVTADRPEVVDVRPSRRYTSVIIDARGLGLERSMSPKIRRQDGSSVWAGENATPDYAIDEGIVGYARSMDEARSLVRAGSRPLVIEALDRYDTPFSSDPILDDEDADFLMEAAGRSDFLKTFRVIFIVDK